MLRVVAPDPTRQLSRRDRHGHDRRWTSCAWTRSARCRWTPCRRPTPGHPGTPMALAPLAYVLYTRVMRHNPSNPDWIDRDRFVLSAGHASMLLYSTLYLTGYPLTLEDIKHFRQVGSPTAGHPERKYSPGIEATTGPLGQGISMSVGIALAERMLAARFNRRRARDRRPPHVRDRLRRRHRRRASRREASSLAGHLGLGRLIAFYDDNKIQLAGPTSQSFSEDVGRALRGLRLARPGRRRGHRRSTVSSRRSGAAMAVQDRPSLIIVRSHIGYGSPHKQDTSAAHGSPLGEDEVRLTKEALRLGPRQALLRARGGARRTSGDCCERGARARGRVARALRGLPRGVPRAGRASSADDRAGKLPDGLGRDVPRFDAADKIRSPPARPSGEVIQWARQGDPAAGRRLGRPVAPRRTRTSRTAASVENGAYARSQHPLRRPRARDGRDRQRAGRCTVSAPSAATFLTFSDYMRGAIRLSALMKLPSIWVYTHDSIGLGEDGPTHQPIEQLAGLRAMPRSAGRAPGRRERDRAGLALRAQAHEAADRVRAVAPGQPRSSNPDEIPDDAIERGAYVLRDARASPASPS